MSLEPDRRHRRQAQTSARTSWPLLVGLCLSALATTSAPAATRHRHHARHGHVARHSPITAPPAYGQAFDPQPTCRYADGTPFDPDIIGGPNHVGDGGPAANLGGFDPCGL